MPSPEEMFSRIDTDGDGSLSSAEINNSFVSRMLRDVDTSSGLSRDQFLEEMQRARERFGRGGRDRGDSDRRRDRSDGDGDRGAGTSGDGSAPPAASGAPTPAPANGTAPAGTPAARVRVTIDLQADLLSADTDRDGQLGLYEWRRSAGRSLREFQQLDLNGDGFVTPREYETVRPAPAPAPVATPVAAAAPAAQSPMPDPAAVTPAQAEAGAPTSAATMPADSPATRDAVRFFGLLDTNGDGQIAPTEWVDGRIRDLFTKNAVDMSQPLKVADFATHYVRLSTNP